MRKAGQLSGWSAWQTHSDTQLVLKSACQLLGWFALQLMSSSALWLVGSSAGEFVSWSILSWLADGL